MTETTFFRLLDADINDKGAALNDEPLPSEAAEMEETGAFTADPAKTQVSVRVLGGQINSAVVRLALPLTRK